MGSGAPKLALRCVKIEEFTLENEAIKKKEIIFVFTILYHYPLGIVRSRILSRKINCFSSLE